MLFFHNQATISQKSSNRTKKLSKQLPNIYRFITEYFSKNHNSFNNFIHLAPFLFIGFFLGLCLSELYFVHLKLQKIAKLEEKRISLQNKINSWENIANKYPNYSELYLKIAYLEYSMGDSIKAKKHLQQALGLNPGSPQSSVLIESIK